MTNSAPATGFGQYFADQGPKYENRMRKRKGKKKKKKKGY